MSESDYSSTASSDIDESNESSSLDTDVDFGAIEPYEDDPLASESADSESSDKAIQDPDNIPRAILEQRFDRIISVQSWCVVNF